MTFKFKNMRLGNDMKVITVITTDRDLFDTAWGTSFVDDLGSVFPCRLISVEVCLEVLKPRDNHPCRRELYRLARYAKEHGYDDILMYYERNNQ